MNQAGSAAAWDCADLQDAWLLEERHAERLAWIHPFDRNRSTQGEARRRLAELSRVDELLGAVLGSERHVALWLRLPNAELHGATPLAWMAGPTARIVQIRLRLEKEQRA